MKKEDIRQIIEDYAEIKSKIKIRHLGILKELDFADQNLKIFLLEDNRIDIKTLISSLKHKLESYREINSVEIFTIKNNQDSKNNKRFVTHNINNIILVLSGKGGVGKSVISSILAYQLKASGFKVGLVDCDIYGPSLGNILNTETKHIINRNSILEPTRKDGIPFISMSNLIDNEKPIMWRGPLINKTIIQMIVSTNWGNLDYLIIDTPPGTGEVHISLMQYFNIAGAIIVTQPNKLSIMDTHKTCSMTKEMDIKILGIVENFSFMQIDDKKSFCFGNEETSILANKFNTKIITKIPHIASMVYGDSNDIHSICSSSIEYSKHIVDHILQNK